MKRLSGLGNVYSESRKGRPLPPALWVLMALASLFHHLTLSEWLLWHGSQGHTPCALHQPLRGPGLPANPPSVQGGANTLFYPACVFPELWSPGSLLTRWVHTCDEIPNEPSSPRNLLSSGGRLTSPVSGMWVTGET